MTSWIGAEDVAKRVMGWINKIYHQEENDIDRLTGQSSLTIVAFNPDSAVKILSQLKQPKVCKVFILDQENHGMTHDPRFTNKASIFHTRDQYHPPISTKTSIIEIGDQEEKLFKTHEGDESPEKEKTRLKALEHLQTRHDTSEAGDKKTGKDQSHIFVEKRESKKPQKHLRKRTSESKSVPTERRTDRMSVPKLAKQRKDPKEAKERKESDRSKEQVETFKDAPSETNSCTLSLSPSKEHIPRKRSTRTTLALIRAQLMQLMDYQSENGEEAFNDQHELSQSQSRGSRIFREPVSTGVLFTHAPGPSGVM